MLGFFYNRKSLLDSGLLHEAVDNHSHILYGLDDGVKKADESLLILKFLETTGLKTIWFTPHTMEDVPNTTEGLQKRFEELKAKYSGPLSFRLASEYMMDTLFMERLRNRDLLLHGQDRVLVETSTWSPPIDFWKILEDMMKAGYRPLLAHPERYRYMNENDYMRLHKMGVVFQMNLPSILGVYGEQVFDKANFLLEKGWYSMVGADCHRFRAIDSQYHSKILKKETIKYIEPLMGGLED